MPANIGIGVTTYNRPERARETIEHIRKHSPGIPLVVINDGGETPDLPAEVQVFTTPYNKGVAGAKNECLKHLHGYEHIFLFDDDTYPTADDWWKPYVESHEPHLMYQFPSAPSHWRLTETYRDENLVAYDKARGCLLYIHGSVLDIVGGMHLAFGKHGGEHEDWSLRIHDAGLTSHPFADVPNPSIYCADQDEKNISSVDYRESKWWKLVDRERLPRFAEYRDMAIPVFVPRRSDGGHRDELWNFIRVEYWASMFYRIIEGESPDGPFNRAAAINDAARKAGNWDVAVVADGDAWVPEQNLDRAIMQARKTGKLVSALSEVYELDEDTSRHVTSCGFHALDHTRAERVRVRDLETQSLCVVVPRPLFEAVHGFDERFVGWGGEDNAFWRACEIVGGTPERISGPAYHLWHPSGAPTNKAQDPLYRANWDLWTKYRKARTLADLRRI